MKNIVLRVVFFTILPGFLLSQTIHENYQDGKIWFKLKQGELITTPIGPDSDNEALTNIPVIRTVDRIASVKKVTRSFPSIVNYPTLTNVYLLQLNDPGKVDDIIEMLQSSPEIEYAEKVPLDKPMAPPNDPYFNSQWELNLINATQAWTYSPGSASVKVAIVDDAIQANPNPFVHQDLDASIWVNPGEGTLPDGIDNDNNGYRDDIRGFDVALNTWTADPPNAQYYHGTQVAGVIGATTNNNIGVASIGNGIKIIPVKATDSPNTISNGYEGIYYAAVVGADVICMAWGSPISSITGQNIIDYAHSQGCVLVAAAGNDNSSAMFYPAAYDHVIAVAATQNDDKKASFSNYGSWVDVSAPGVNVFTTVYSQQPVSGYGVASGTSISAGMVAGLAGLMLSVNPGLTPAEVENCIRSSAASIATQNPAFPGMLGNGRIDAAAAMGCISACQYIIPVADFKANTTNVMRGGKVVFANTSQHSADSYTWHFPGGIPSTTITTTPSPVEVTYPTMGVYTVSLVATRTSTLCPGTDVETKAGYINVGFGGTCDTTHWQHTYKAPLWTPRLYEYHDSVKATLGLYWMGVNSTNTKEKAQMFDLSGFSQNQLLKVWIWFGAANVRSGGSAAGKHIRVKVYDKIASSGNPNSEIYRSPEIPFQRIIDDVAAGRMTEIVLPTPVTIQEEAPGVALFYVSVAMMGDSIDGGNLNWDTDRDTLAMVSNAIGETSGTGVFHMANNGTWCRIDGNCGPGVPVAINPDISLYIFPFLTDQLTNATFIQSEDTICEGNYVIYDASGSTNQDTLYWTFEGGNPSHSNKLRDTVFYVNTNSALITTYNTTLVVRGGGCIDSDTMVSSLRVLSSPRITVTANPSSICSGSGSTITATASSSQAPSFVWSPATGLSATTGNLIYISPTSSQTYEVYATSADGCNGNTTLMVQVDTMPVAVASVVDTACRGELVQFNGALSTGGTYTWITPGASVPLSSAANHAATYTVTGNYTYTLQVENSCGTDVIVDLISIKTCSVTPSVPELFSGNTVKAFYNVNNSSVDLSVSLDNSVNNVYVILINTLGQQGVAKVVNLAKGTNTFSLDVDQLARGVYSIQITDNKTSSYTQKLVIH